jgi:hypothetical protein
MQFATIKPKLQALELIETTNLKIAQLAVGLTEVDHGIFWRKDDGLGLAYVVYEYALYEPRPEEQSYAAVFGKFIAGNAVVYAFDHSGETIPVTPEMISEKDIKWLPTLYSAEMAIAHRRVSRPIIAVQGKVLWRWPETRPDLEKIAKLTSDNFKDKT